MLGGGQRDRLFEGVGNSDLDLHSPSPPPKPESLWSWPLPHQSRFGEGATATSCSLLPHVLLNGFLQGYSVLKSLLLDPWNQSPVSGPSPTSLLDAGNRGVQKVGGKTERQSHLPSPVMTGEAGKSRQLLIWSLRGFLAACLIFAVGATLPPPVLLPPLESCTHCFKAPS